MKRAKTSLRDFLCDIMALVSFLFASIFFSCTNSSIEKQLSGTPTGGSTGNPIVIDLGRGYYGRICTRHEKLADGMEFIGVGI